MAKWTRTHYEQSAEILAGAMRNARTDAETSSIEYVAARFAHMYATDNPRFDHASWNAAIFERVPV